MLITTTYFCLNSKSNISDKVKLEADIENDLQSINLGKKMLVNFNISKTKLPSFNHHIELILFIYLQILSINIGI